MKKLYRLQLYLGPISFNSSILQIFIGMAFLGFGKIVTYLNNLIYVFCEMSGLVQCAGKNVHYVPVSCKKRNGTYSRFQNRLLSCGRSR